MYFVNLRLWFKVPSLRTPISGSIIAASAISAVELKRREFVDHAHLGRRLLDPQLYMARLDSATDEKTVAKLASYPWFHGGSVPAYDSGQYSGLKDWKAKHDAFLVSRWTREIPRGGAELRRSARAAVEFQLSINCESIILAAPLTTIADQTLAAETDWLDAGLEACSELRVGRPIFATIALSEPVLYVPPLQNPVIHSLTNIVSTRPELAGAYIVLEQMDPSRYFWNSKDPLMSLLVLVDDLHRGAGKTVIVNYVGTFGLVAAAVGADVWSSGYYLMQRRFSLKGETGRAHPRYHSLSLAGDIGLKSDLGRIQRMGLLDNFMTPTTADSVLRAALSAGLGPERVPEWAYKQSNIGAARQHYLEIAADSGAMMQGLSVKQRVEWVQAWLKGAVERAELLRGSGITEPFTNTEHQRVWLDVFEEWRRYARQ